MRAINSKGRALAQRRGLIEECHVAGHIDFEGVIAILVNDFFYCVGDVGREFCASKYLISFTNFGIAVSSPVSSNPEYASCQNVVKADIVATDGDSSNVRDGRVSPAKGGISICFPAPPLTCCFTMYRLGCIVLR